jgi:hypothetical protein
MTALHPIALAVGLMIAGGTLAQEVGQTNRATELKAQARPDAATVAPLPSGTELRVLERVAGGWARVDAAGKMGWLRTFHFSLQGSVETAKTGGGLLASVGAAVGGGRQQQTGIASIGVRGLSEEDMQKATPNPAEFAKMKAQALTRDQGEAFGRASRLQANKVAYVGDRGQPLAGGAQ